MVIVPMIFAPSLFAQVSVDTHLRFNIPYDGVNNVGLDVDDQVVLAYAAAFDDADVQDAIKSGALGRIAVTVTGFHGPLYPFNPSNPNYFEDMDTVIIVDGHDAEDLADSIGALTGTVLIDQADQTSFSSGMWKPNSVSATKTVTISASETVFINGPVVNFTQAQIDSETNIVDGLIPVSNHDSWSNSALNYYTNNVIRGVGASITRYGSAVQADVNASVKTALLKAIQGSGKQLPVSVDYGWTFGGTFFTYSVQTPKSGDYDLFMSADLDTWTHEQDFNQGSEIHGSYGHNISSDRTFYQVRNNGNAVESEPIVLQKATIAGGGDLHTMGVVAHNPVFLESSVTSVAGYTLTDSDSRFERAFGVNSTEEYIVEFLSGVLTGVELEIVSYSESGLTFALDIQIEGVVTGDEYQVRKKRSLDDLFLNGSAYLDGLTSIAPGGNPAQADQIWIYKGTNSFQKYYYQTAANGNAAGWNQVGRTNLAPLSAVHISPLDPVFIKLAGSGSKEFFFIGAVKTNPSSVVIEVTASGVSYLSHGFAINPTITESGLDSQVFQGFGGPAGATHIYIPTGGVANGYPTWDLVYYYEDNYGGFFGPTGWRDVFGAYNAIIDVDNPDNPVVLSSVLGASNGGHGALNLVIDPGN